MFSVPEFAFALREDLKDKLEFLPTKAYPTDTGWDVRCAEPDGVLFVPFEYKKIRLGIRSFCPDEFWYELKPRSSTFGKKYLHCLYGTIDQTWEGELLLACQYLPPLSLVKNYDKFDYVDIDQKEYYLNIPFGEKIAQIIPVHRQKIVMSQVSNEEIDKLFAERNAARKTGGFGSTN